MTALACLRILSDPDRLVAGVEIPTAPVRRIVAAFLVGRWTRPRRFGEVAPGAFVLTDPDVDHLGAAPLVPLSRELRHCPVTLVLFNGGQTEVTRFAALHAADLRAVLDGAMVVEGMHGDLSVLAPDGIHPVVEAGDRAPLRLIMEDFPVRERLPRAATGVIG